MPNPRNMVKVVDLFSGVGGFSLGAARAGFRVALAVDNDDIMVGTYSANFPGTQILPKDVSTLTHEEILQAAGIGGQERFGVIAGPPCQGMSCMGKMDPDDPRNRLFLRPFRFVKEANPSFFVVETVPGILSDRFSKLRKKALGMIPKQYARISGVLVRACDCGVPTYRRRVFFAGYIPAHFRSPPAKDLGVEPCAIKNLMTAGKAFYGLPHNVEIVGATGDDDEGFRKIKKRPPDQWNGFYSRIYADIPPGVGDNLAIEMCEGGFVSGIVATEHSKKVIRRYKSLLPGTRDAISKAARLHHNRPAPTIRAGTGSDMGRFQAVRPVHYRRPRVITPREAARIQGFPDWFVFHKTKWHSFRQIGNSVSPFVAEQILRQFRQGIKLRRSAGGKSSTD